MIFYGKFNFFIKNNENKLLLFYHKNTEKK